MRSLILIGVLALATGACSKKAPPAAVPAPARTMPVGSDAPFQTGLPDQARVRTDLSAAREAIQRGQQMNGGKSPANLAELGLKLHYPEDLIYDPAAGTIKSKTYPQF